MSRSDDTATADESIHREYVLDVRIVECDPHDGGDPTYRFEAPQHRGEAFEDPERAELYADVYFDVNGFEEAGTGERGVPPEIIQAGRDTLAAYFLTQPGTDENWVASFFGVTVEKVQQYVAWVENRSEEIRRGAEERGIA
ncbi:hypothetical protein G9464_08045 [Halostella sp. JP-L12]|uniref:hypothetical protein n=1 Tax=Halostella TaxID=1843185 RepID=UPI000EF7F7A7|nr:MULTISPECIES: hypothetical protein [Halostella]NHN47546.1 hypothetical protein [Halostella sp. JP-L12]